MPTPRWSNLPGTARVAGTLFHVVESPAEGLIRGMEIERGRVTKAFLAEAALDVDPGCIEAHLFLAACHPEPHAVYGHLKKAVESGKALWNPVASAQDDFAWWGVHATRPYMRAIKALADWMAECGDDMSARRLYKRLLKMNPNDNQGVRYVLGNLPETVLPMVMR